VPHISIGRIVAKALNDIYPTHCGDVLGPWTCGGTSNEITEKLTRGGSVHKFVGPEPSLGVSRQNINNKMKLWVDNQHLIIWSGPCSTQIQAEEFISGPSVATKARLLSFKRTQSGVITGLHIGHNTLRRRLYVTELSNNPTCMKCGTEKETSVHNLCECEALVSLRHTYLCSFILDP
jgi:hypothetical protein